MDTTFALPLPSSRIVGVCRALGAVPGFVGTVEGITTLLDVSVAAEMGSVASALSVLGVLKIFAFAYGRFARRVVENEARGS